MGRIPKNRRFGIFDTLKWIGKPSLFLFTGSILVLYLILRLFTNFTLRLFYTLRRLHVPAIRVPRISVTPFRVRLSHKLLLLVGFVCVIGAAGSAVYQSVLKNLPSPLILRDHLPSLSTRIVDRHGELLYQVYRDENRTLISLGDVPAIVIQATIASEDKDFYRHPGISVKGIVRAGIHNFVCSLKNQACTSIQGGSTITQQLVKNSLITPEKTLTRKLKEAYLAMQTEHLYSKDEILEMYFNYVPYGGTAYGIKEAAEQYFGKSVRDLSLAESALLAGLPVAPTTLSPFGTHPYLAKNRQSQVLNAMVASGYISKSDAEKAAAETITLSAGRSDIKAPHFVMYVKDLLVRQFGEDIVNHGGLEVTTTLDLPSESILEGEIETELNKLHHLNVGNAAGLITNPKNGDILAMAGSHDFFDVGKDGQVNVVASPRQPGSSIKPITYSLAFMHGLTPESLIEDSPVCFTIPGQPNYCPTNYDKRFHGRVTARTALASSYNVPAIKVLNSMGVLNMVELAKKMGITTWNHPERFGLSLTLGGGEVTMLDMAEVYGVFANGGTKVPLRAILSVKDANGQELIVAHEPAVENVIPASVAYEISSILSDPKARAPAFGIHSVLNIPGYPVAVKTGTTNDLRDNWTFGYTPDVVVATWVGNNDNSPMSAVASGVTGASPIWSHTMQKLLAGSAPNPFPLGEKIADVKSISVR